MYWIGVEVGKENKKPMEGPKAGLNTTGPEWVVALNPDDYIQAWKKLTCQLYLCKGQLLYFNLNFTHVSSWQYTCNRFGNGLVPNRQHAIIWIKDDPVPLTHM